MPLLYGSSLYSNLNTNLSMTGYILDHHLDLEAHHIRLNQFKLINKLDYDYLDEDGNYIGCHVYAYNIVSSLFILELYFNLNLVKVQISFDV